MILNLSFLKLFPLLFKGYENDKEKYNKKVRDIEIPVLSQGVVDHSEGGGINFTKNRFHYH